jgi:hypothetical protein
MPGIIIHTLLGDQILGRWTANQADAPFRSKSSETEVAFAIDIQAQAMCILFPLRLAVSIIRTHHFFAIP